jgi:ribosomal protein L28
MFHANNKTKPVLTPVHRRFLVETENRWVRLRITLAPVCGLVDKRH